MDIYAWALTTLEMYTGERLWEKGEEAAEQCGQYFDKCRVEVPASMRELITRCLTEKPADFSGVLESLEQIYREVTGHGYPRKYPEKAASDTAPEAKQITNRQPRWPFTQWLAGLCFPAFAHEGVAEFTNKVSK